MILLLCCAMIALQRWHTFEEPIEWDLATYTLVARQILDGGQLYVDAWDLKPPGIFAAHVMFQSVLGDGPTMFLVSSSLIAMLTMLAIWKATPKGNGWPGLLAAGAFAFISADLQVEGNHANTEAYINLLLACGLATMMRASSLKGVILACLLFALATMFKQVACIPAIAILLFVQSPVRVRVRCAVLAVTMVLTWGLIFTYFALTNRGALAWQTLVLVPHEYSKMVAPQLTFLLDLLRAEALISFLPLLVLSLLAILLDAASRRLLLALFAACAIAIVLPGRLWNHYLQLLFLPMCIGCAAGISAIAERTGRRATVFASIILLAGLAILQLPSFRLPAKQWTERQYGGGYAILQDCIQPLREMLKDDETLFIWADEPWIYYHANRRLPTALVARSHVVYLPVGDYLTKKVLEDLSNTRPDLLLVREGQQGPADHPIWRYLMQHYRPLPFDARRFPMLHRYARIGSELDKHTRS